MVWFQRDRLADLAKNQSTTVWFEFPPLSLLFLFFSLVKRPFFSVGSGRVSLVDPKNSDRHRQPKGHEKKVAHQWPSCQRPGGGTDVDFFVSKKTNNTLRKVSTAAHSLRTGEGSAADMPGPSVCALQTNRQKTRPYGHFLGTSCRLLLSPESLVAAKESHRHAP